MPQVRELTNRVLKILDEERELNRDDPLIDSLLTRIANRVTECEQQLRREMNGGALVTTAEDQRNPPTPT